MNSSPPIAISRDFRDMLGLLLKHGVEFLLIGGHALGIHAEPRFTRDIDFFVRPTPENARKLWAALAEFGAPLSLCNLEDFTVPDRVVHFGIPPNRIDFTMSMEGVSFAAAWRERIPVEFADLVIPVISRKHLILNKQAVGRAKDLLDVRTLLADGRAAKKTPRRTPPRRKKK